jgi:aryl-phospho-beta-D-glucosidase BglC (GH1 family)
MVAMACVGAMAAGCTSDGSSNPKGTGAQATPINGWLSTMDGRIVNQQGRPVRFLGVGITELAPGRGQTAEQAGGGCLGWTRLEPEVYDNIDAWGFNVVRLAVSWANIEPTPPSDGGPLMQHHWNAEYLAAVDEAVNRFTSRGVAVILEMSQNFWSPAFQRSRGSPCPGRGMPAWLYEGTSTNTVDEAKVAFFKNHGGIQAAYAGVWKLMAQRYADNPMVVGADLVNEPYLSRPVMQPEEMRLDQLYANLARTIRAVNPKILLIFQDSQDKGDGEFAVKNPPPVPGVVYSFHLYTKSWDQGGLRRTQHFEERARHWHVPLYIGEFNAFGYGNETGTRQPPRDWEAQVEEMMRYCKSHRLSWTFWAYSGGNSMVQSGTHEPKPGLLPVLQGGF